MKKLLFFISVISVLFLTNCTDNRKTLILSHIRKNATIDNMTIELSPKILELKNLNPIIGQDSLMYWDSTLKSINPIEKIERELLMSEEFLVDWQNNLKKAKELGIDISFEKEKMAEFTNGIQKYNTWLKNIKERNDYTDTNWEWIANKITKYNSISTTILANVIACKYQIKNPLLGLTTINTVYYFSPDNKKILKEKD